VHRLRPGNKPRIQMDIHFPRRWEENQDRGGCRWGPQDANAIYILHQPIPEALAVCVVAGFDEGSEASSTQGWRSYGGKYSFQDISFGDVIAHWGLHSMMRAVPKTY